VPVCRTVSPGILEIRDRVALMSRDAPRARRTRGAAAQTTSTRMCVPRGTGRSAGCYGRGRMVGPWSAVLLFGAGCETMNNLLSNGLRTLLDHPARLAALQESPHLAPTVVEEMLRYDSPVRIAARTALEPAVVAGEQLPLGGMVMRPARSSRPRPEPLQASSWSRDRSGGRRSSGPRRRDPPLSGSAPGRARGPDRLLPVGTTLRVHPGGGPPVRRPTLTARGHAYLPRHTSAGELPVTSGARRQCGTAHTPPHQGRGVGPRRCGGLVPDDPSKWLWSPGWGSGMVGRYTAARAPPC
jgi:hypothetical protein